MPRLFTGVPIDASLRDGFPEIFACSDQDGLRATCPTELHTTLQFVGDVEECVASRLDSELSMIPWNRFDIEIRGVGCFEGQSADRILWAVVERTAGLIDLHTRIGKAFACAGVAPEQRRYNPHITLARLSHDAKWDVDGFLSKRKSFAATTSVNAFALYRVQREKSSQRYEPWRSYEHATEK